MHQIRVQNVPAIGPVPLGPLAGNSKCKPKVGSNSGLRIKPGKNMRRSNIYCETQTRPERALVWLQVFEQIVDGE
jgi:hypothetical protein